MRASVPLSLVGLAVLLTVLGLVRRPFTPTGAADGELVRQLRQELAVAQRSLREQALLAERSQLATQSLARPSPGSATGVGVRSYTHSVATMPMRRGDWAMMTYATGGVHEMLHNWVLHVQRIGAPILAIAMDEPVLEQCSRQRFDCLDWSKTKSSLDSSYVRGDESGFRKLGVRKVDALVAVLRAGVHAILSDVDCVWSHDPGPLVRGIAPGYAAFAQADLISATDCMSPDSDLRDAGCFSGLIDKNTGVLAVRATEDGIRAMREWRHRLAIGQKNEQDQTTFVDMVDGNGRGHRWGMTGPQRAAWREFGAEWCGTAQHAAGRGFSRRSGAETEGERGTFDVCLPNVTRTLRMGVFPITDVAGGHTFFVQNLQAVTGKWPAAVHATYQFGDQADYPFGKRQRFRDWGMWLVDDDATLPPASQHRYLVLTEDLPLADAAPWTCTKGSGCSAEELHARGRQHVDHLNRLRQRLASGVALARVLNRTLVLPTFYCYCDKFWHRLHACAIADAADGSQPLPFICPMDHIVDLSMWHGSMEARTSRPVPGSLASRQDGPWRDGIPFRGAYWLRRLGSQPSIGLSVATLATRAPERRAMKVSPALLEAALTHPTTNATAAAGSLVTHAYVPGEWGPRLVLHAGQTDRQLREAVAPYAHVSLLQVSLSDASSLLRCYDSPSEAAEVRRLVDFAFRAVWCYRPAEMTEEWTRVELQGKPQRGTEPWCVWGFDMPTTQQAC